MPIPPSCSSHRHPRPLGCPPKASCPSRAADPFVHGIFCRVEIRSVVDELCGFGSKGTKGCEGCWNKIQPFIPNKVGVLCNLLFLLRGGHRFCRADIETTLGRTVKKLKSSSNSGKPSPPFGHVEKKKTKLWMVLTIVFKQVNASRICQQHAGFVAELFPVQVLRNN